MLLLVLLACPHPPPPAPPGPEVAAPLTRDDAAPLFAELTRDGPRVVSLFATWCAPCAVELPMVDDVTRRVGIPLVLVDLDAPMIPDSAVHAYLAPLVSPNVMVRRVVDPDPSVLAAALPAWRDGIPLTLLVDADGVRGSFVGVADPMALEGALRAMLATTAP
jgi:thiol-disulfide isomerase/thioredoxin